MFCCDCKFVLLQFCESFSESNRLTTALAVEDVFTFQPEGESFHYNTTKVKNAWRSFPCTRRLQHTQRHFTVHSRRHPAIAWLFLLVEKTMRLQWLVAGTRRIYVWVMEKVHKHARLFGEQPFGWAVVSHSMLFWNIWSKRSTQDLTSVTYLICLCFIFLKVFRSLWKGCLINKGKACTVGLCVLYC